jgi:peptidoglycan-N-acetylglucosamine deacetylase
MLRPFSYAYLEAMYWRHIPQLLSRLFPEWEWRTNEGSIALTFDDGPHPESTPKLLQLLDHLSLPATHFLSGSNAETNPDLMQAIREQGHVVGHHGYQHLNGWKTGQQVYLEDIVKGAEIIGGTLFRPPYGKILPNQWRALRKQLPAVRCIQFSLMPGDFDSTKSAQDILQSLMEAESGEVIVLHDTPESFEKYAPVLADWAAAMRQKGLRFVTL